MVSYKLVDVKVIQSDQPRSNFNESEIEEIADLFLASGILARPLIVKEIGPDIFRVLYGHKEYYGSVKAREKDPRKAEMVNAFVIDRKDNQEVEAALLKQVSQPPPPPVSVPNSEISGLGARIDNLERRIDRQQQVLQTFQQDFSKDVEQKLKAIEASIPKRRSFLEEINTLEPPKLLLRLQGLGVSNSDKICQQIVKERKKKAFASFQDVVDRLRNNRGNRLVTEQKMLKLLDIASQTVLID
ncbi:DUF655 domain-containing protein [Trichothermofontia sp.]